MAKSAAEVVAKMLASKATPIPQADLERHGKPGDVCYVCGCTERWRMDDQSPWICKLCHPDWRY
jgi:phage/plasmid primase-like uncharacterized protein